MVTSCDAFSVVVGAACQLQHLLRSRPVVILNLLCPYFLLWCSDDRNTGSNAFGGGPLLAQLVPELRSRHSSGFILDFMCSPGVNGLYELNRHCSKLFFSMRDIRQKLYLFYTRHKGGAILVVKNEVFHIKKQRRESYTNAFRCT